MRILKRFLLVAPALALLGVFLLGSLLQPPTARAQEQRPVNLELSMANRHEGAASQGTFVVSVRNNSDIAVRNIKVQLEVEDIALGASIFLQQATGGHLPDSDGLVDYDTLEWTIPRLGARTSATTLLLIDFGPTSRGLSATEDSVVRLRGSIVESTPRERPAALGNNQAHTYVSTSKTLRSMRIVWQHSVSYGVDADTDTFTVKVVNRNLGGTFWHARTPIQYQLRLRVTPSQGLRYTAAAAPAGTTFDAATGIWDIGTLGHSPSNDKQLDIRVTGRDASAGPAEEQCLTVEIEHKVPDALASWLPVTACMAHKALITGGQFDIFNWHDCVTDSDYPCGSQPSLELTAVKSAFELRGVGDQALEDVHRARFRTDRISSGKNSMILQPEDAVLQVPDWPLNRKTESGNTIWSTVDLIDLFLGHQNLQDAGGWTDLKVSGTVTAPGGGPAPGSLSLQSHSGRFTFFTATDDTKKGSRTYQVNQLGQAYQFPIRIEFGTLGTYLALLEIEGTKSGTPYTDSGTYTFHVGPVAELAIRGLRADEPAPGVEPGQTALTVVAVNNGPDHALGAKVDVTLPAGVTVASHAASDGTYDEATGTWDLGALQHRDYRTINGHRPEATLTLILEGENAADATATATISNDNDNHPYTVCIDSSGEDVDANNQSACEAVTGQSWHEGTVYDYIDANNTATLTARAGTGEPLPDATELTGPSTAAVVQWSPVDTVNGWPVSHYEVQRAASPWQTVTEVKEPFYADTDVTPGQRYTYRVRAVNNRDVPGPWSQPMEVTAPFPAGVQVPGVPTDLTVLAGDGRLTASWGEPEHLGNPRLNGYSVQYRQQGAELWTDATRSGTGRSQTITGLTNGTAYQVRVAAVNSSGTGEYASASATSVAGAAVPGAPTDLAVTVGDGQLTLSWIAPTDSGTPAMHGYLVQYRVSGPWQTWTRTASGALSTAETITGLENGRTYQVRVAAVNTAGASGYPTASGRPVGQARAPDAPGNLTLTPGDGRIAASWDEPAHVGTPRLNGYSVEYREQGAAAWTDANHRGTGRARTITGLVNGTTYDVRVAAMNATGKSDYATASTAPAGPPTAPQNLTLAPNDRIIDASWEAPAGDGGSAIDGYLVQYRASGSWQTWRDPEVQTGTHTHEMIYDLTNGRRYQVRVAAVNAAGVQGAWAQGSAVPNVPQSAPSEPPNVVPTGGNGQIKVSWREPYDVGNPALSGYRVQYREDGATAWLPATPISVSRNTTEATITGLTNGTTYQVRVWAVNSAGDSPKAGDDGKLKATPLDPDRRPSAPRNLALTPGDGEIQVSWDAPSDLGKPEIDGYTVQYRASGETSWKAQEAKATSATITGLTNGTEYEVRVRAANGQGDAIAGPKKATPATGDTGGQGEPEPEPEGAPPTAPRNLSLMPGAGRIEVSWDPPQDLGNPEITGYTVQYRETGGDSWTSRSSKGTLASITGLTNGTEYEVRVVASNAQGEAVAGPKKATPKDPGLLPTAPQDLTHEQQNEEDVDGSALKVILVTWLRPDADSEVDGYQDRGTTGYRVQFRRGTSGDWLDRRCSLSENAGPVEETCSDHQGDSIQVAGIAGVSSGTWQVRVAAVNREGIGPWAMVTHRVR